VAGSGQDNLPWAGGSSIAVIAIIVGLFVVQQSPFHSLRPTADHQGFPSHGDEDVQARLWQDPFAVTLKDWEASFGKQGETAIMVRIGTAELPEQPAQPGKKHTPERQLKVFVQPEPAPDKRHAFSNLNSQIRKSPGKTTILGVMAPGGPYGAVKERRIRSRYAVLAGLGVLGYQPVDAEHIGYVAPDNSKTRGSENRLPDIIPYEWFGDEKSNRVLIIWLQDEAFHSKPFEKLASIAELLPGSIRGIRILGPAGSTTLQVMTDELSDLPPAKKGSKDTWRMLRNVQIFSPVATAPNSDLWGEDRQVLPDELNKRFRARIDAAIHNGGKNNARFIRTIAPDDRLMELLARELELRGADPHCTGSGYKRGKCNHIVLISELDTRYGQLLPKAFINNVKKAGIMKAPWVHRVHYLRGIDGYTPDTKRGPSVDRKDSGNRPAANGEDIEKAAGRGQQDYLRRLSAQLIEMDRNFKRKALFGKGIRAIGILGSDVYDKIMILQALRPYFPQVIFFTTDLDASLLHPAEFPWTRNLIVASSFDLRLGDTWQKGAPPFRSNYQSATFLSTQLALGPDQGDLNQTAINAKIQPRIFEIGRKGPVPMPPIEPTTESDFYPAGLLTPKIAIALMAIAVILAIILALLWSKNYGVRPRGVLFITGSVISILVVIILFLPFKDLAFKDIEPFSWTAGISIWPTEIIRLVSALLCAYLIYHAWQRQKENIEHIDRALAPSTNKAVKSIWQQHWRQYCEKRKASADCSSLHLNYWPAIQRVAFPFVVFVVFGMVVMLINGFPHVPYRGMFSLIVDKAMVIISVFLLLCLIAFVLDFTWTSLAFVDRLTNYGNDTLSALCMHDKSTGSLKDGRLIIQLIAERTEAVSNLIYYPILIIILLLAARSRYFDAWDMPYGLIIVISASFLLTVSCAIVLRRRAEKCRKKFIGNLKRFMVMSQEPDRKQKDIMAFLEFAKTMHYGAFRPLARQPWIHALTLFLGGGGSLVFLQYLYLFD